MKVLKNTGLLFTIAFLAAIFISGYFLLQLRSDLSVNGGILSAAEVPAAMPYIIRLQVSVFAAFAVGLLGFYFIQRHHHRELIYVEKSDEERRSVTSEDIHETVSGTDKLAAEVSLILKKEKSLEKAFQKLCNVQQAVAGALYKVSGDQTLELTVPFALSFPDSKRPAYKFGEGFVGQSAKDRKPIFIDDIPEHTHTAISGLGGSPPKFLSIIPLIQNETLVGVCELGTFSKVNEPEVLTKACEALAANMPHENGKSEKSKS